MKVVLFLLDAYKEEYLSKTNTPFLYNLSKNGKHIKKIIPSAGFCERTEIFFGLKPNESNFFTAIGYDPENSPYKKSVFFNLIGNTEIIISRLSSFLWFNKKKSILYFYRKMCIKLIKFLNLDNKKLSVYNIPFNFLEYFNLTEDEFELDKIDKIHNKESIFKLISKLNGYSYMGSFTSLGQKSNGDDKNRIRLAIKAFKNKKYIFFPIYISIADSYGHNFGPDSKEIKKELNRLDKLLEVSMNKFLNINKKTKFLFLGDHGMSKVNSTIDIQLQISKISKKYNLKQKLDFIYFLDSTLFRMWFFNNKSKKIFTDEISKNPLFNKNGFIVDSKIADKYNIPFKNRKYGDLMWWAKKGILIHPDFFHPHKVMFGMHGYEPIFNSTYGTCIIWHNDIKKEKVKSLELFKIYDEIIKLLDYKVISNIK